MGDFHILSIRIKQLRKEMNLTQLKFSKIVGCTAATLSAYENGSKSPSLEIIKNIAENCNVSIDWLIGLSDKKESEPEIETYSDIFKLLFDIDEALKKRNLKLRISTEDTGYGGEISYLSFSESKYETVDSENNFNIFLSDWNKMKTMYDEEIIDKEVYELWKEKTLNKYLVLLADLSGKDKVIDYAADLAGNPDYRKESDASTPIAAHNDNADDEEQQKLMKEDIDEL